MAHRKLLAASVLLATLALAQGWGGFASWYSCDDSSCTGANNCVCPSASPPGGLDPSETPQFVLVTHDDAITEMTDNVMRYVLDGFKNPNGCNLPATMFTLANEDTDCALARGLYDDNYEIASHTKSHLNLDASFTGDRNNEIVGARQKLAADCGIPMSDIVGFRSPYLINNPQIRQILSTHGFLYDSTIDEHFPSSTSKDASSRLWPYTMDQGIIQNCNWTYPDGNCNTDERYPGLWSIPVWDLQNENHSKSFTMDVYGDVYGYLKQMFDWSYEGNRAPMPLYVHSPWFNYENTNATKAFITYALSRPNTYFVTMSQLIKYMRAPVPASQLATTLTCKPVSLTPPASLYCTQYPTVAGDTLASVAAKFGVPGADKVAAMLAVNPELRGNTTLAPGTLLRIAPWRPTCDPIPLFIAPVGAPEGAPPPHCRTYKVKSGDSLWSIATAAAVPMEDLAKANNIALPAGLIQDGQVLGIPPYPACCLTPAKCAAAPAPAPVAAPETGLQVDLKLSGVSQATFQSAAFQAKLAASLAPVLGAAPTSIVLESVAPYTGRRLAQAMAATGAAPSSTLAVSMFVNGADPTALYTKAQSSASAVAAAVQGLGLSMVQDPVFTPYKDGKAMPIPVVVAAPAPAPAETALPEESTTTASGGSSGSSFPMWIIGVVVGGVAAVAIVAIVVALVIKNKRQATAMPMHSSSYAGRTNPGATAVLRTGSGPKGAIDADRFVVVKGGSTPSTPTRRNTAFN